MPDIPSLLQSARAGNAGFFLQFGGQAVPWLKELQKIYNENQTVRSFIDICIEAIHEELKNVEIPLSLNQGFDVNKWLTDESTIPAEEYLFQSSISMPMIHLTQMAHFRNLISAGWERKDLIQFTRSATGHSQGMVTATFPALDIEMENDIECARKYAKYFFYLGIRSQECFPNPWSTDAENEESEQLGLKENPSPMAAVLGADTNSVQKLVEENNKDAETEEQVYISLYNSPTNHILSSTRKSLINFYKSNRSFFVENKVKFIFLKSTCPFHSPLMKGFNVNGFSEDLKRISFNFSGTDIKFPVYSFADGRNIQNDKEIGLNMAEDITVRPLYWKKAIASIPSSESITHILDFGAGKAIQRLSSEILLEMSCDKPVLSAVVPRDFKILTS